MIGCAASIVTITREHSRFFEEGSDRGQAVSLQGTCAWHTGAAFPQQVLVDAGSFHDTAITRHVAKKHQTLPGRSETTWWLAREWLRMHNSADCCKQVTQAVVRLGRLMARKRQNAVWFGCAALSCCAAAIPLLLLLAVRVPVSRTTYS